MGQKKFDLRYSWVLFSFIWFGIGSIILLYFLLTSSKVELEEAANGFTTLLVIIWGLAPFGLISRMKRYWSTYVKEEIPKFFLRLFLAESFLLYGNFLFCGFFLIPLKMEWNIPFVYLKILALVLTIPLVVSIFITQKRKLGQPKRAGEG